MSAIFGILHLGDDRPVEPAWLEAMSRALAGCGPHSGGAWHDGGVALGARLLHDTPEAAYERQPLASRDGGAMLVADARIDNPDELEAQLEVETAGGGPIPDSALILAAWQRWGEDCCAHLEGDFAFALWDARQRRLICGRDVMGIKPFYYYHLPGRLVVFASQLAGLLALEAVPRRLDRAAAADHLLRLYDDHQRTLFAGISRLPPAHQLRVDAAGQPSVRRYYSLAPAELRFASDDEWVEALGIELDRAARVRVRAAGGIGAHLSGGLDSSAVVCLAARELGGGPPLLALSFSSPPDAGEPTVDQDYIRDVVDYAAVPLRYAPFDPQLSVDAHDTAAAGMMPPEYETESEHRWAREEGLRVMLSGWGGDEAASFNGRGYLSSLLRRGRWLELARVVAGLRRRGKARRLLPFLAGQAVVPLLPYPLYRLLQARVRRDPAADRLPRSCVSPRLARELGLDDGVNRRGLRQGAGVHAYQLRLLGHGHVVRRIEGWSADASRFGLDYRYPLLDRRLLELCLALPERLSIHDGHLRYAFRAALAGRLPESVQWRGDKADSITHRHQAEPRRQGLEALHRRTVERLMADGNDLGGCLSLDQLERRFEQGFGAGGGRRRAASAVSAGLAVSLALFVERHRIDCGGVLR